MKKQLIFAHAILLLAISAGCSDQDKQTPQSKQQASEQNAIMGPAPKLPASHNLPPKAPATPPTMAHPMPSMASDMPKQGTVKEMMHASGYTYMNVDTGADEPMWIAATMMRVKPEDKVQWSDAAVMRNFKSSTLHRTFDEILFVSNASVIQ